MSLDSDLNLNTRIQLSTAQKCSSSLVVILHRDLQVSCRTSLHPSSEQGSLLLSVMYLQALLPQHIPESSWTPLCKHEHCGRWTWICTHSMAAHGTFASSKVLKQIDLKTGNVIMFCPCQGRTCIKNES